MSHLLKNVEIFKVGDYGARGKWDAAKLDQVVENYDPAEHEAPLTVDHKQDGPAFGWVKRLFRNGKSLLADMTVSPSMFEAIKEGQYRKRSVEFYRHKPGLRALTLLGAGVPFIKGMADVAFKDEADTITFEADAEIDSEIVVDAFEDTMPDRNFATSFTVGEWTVPVSKDGENYDGGLLGQAISYFSPGGFGEDQRKITQGMLGYHSAKARVIHACEAIGKDPHWAAFRDNDILFHPAITVEALREHRPDIFADTQTNEEGENMPTNTEELHDQIAALKADLKKTQNEFGEKNTECVEMSEKLQTLEGEKAKAERETTLKDTVAEAKLPDIAANGILKEFSERDSLDGLEDRITHAKELIASFDGKDSIDDNGGGGPNSDEARMKRVDAIAEEKGISKGEAIREAFKDKK